MRHCTNPRCPTCWTATREPAARENEKRATLNRKQQRRAKLALREGKGL